MHAVAQERETGRFEVVRKAARHWPAALAVVMVLAGAGGSDPHPLGQALLLLPLLYLIVAKIGRRRASWPALGVVVAGFVVAKALDVAVPVVVVVATAVLVWGAVEGRLKRGDTFTVQVAGMLAFGALALAGLAVDPEWSRYLVAAGWFLHGVWDFVHLYKRRAVSRTYAEWCGVVDILVAFQLVFLA